MNSFIREIDQACALWSKENPGHQVDRKAVHDALLHGCRVDEISTAVPAPRSTRPVFDIPEQRAVV